MASSPSSSSCVGGGVRGSLIGGSPIRCTAAVTSSRGEDGRQTQCGISNCDVTGVSASATIGNNSDVKRPQFTSSSSFSSPAAAAAAAAADPYPTSLKPDDLGRPDNDDIVWVTKRFDPTDPRFTVPVARRHKGVNNSVDSRASHGATDRVIGKPCLGPRDWVRTDAVEATIYESQPHTRCEQWSTLREMLPSRGRVEPVSSPNWGTGRCEIPPMTSDRATRFPSVHSEMTRFCDTAHKHDPMFRLY